MITTRSRTPGGSSTNAQHPHRFQKTSRIRKRHEFLAIQRHGKNRYTPHFVVLTAARKDSGSARLGVTVSRKVGNAVARNYLKRQVREFFRQRRTGFSDALDYVIIARSGAARLSHADVVQELRKATGI